MAKNKNKHKPFTAELTMAGESATLDVTGFIGWDTDPMQFTDLVAQAKQAGCTHLTVRINSLGGYCYDGLAIGDCLRDCGMETTAVVIGTAQSMASYILQCCRVREAHRGATIMFHQPSAGVCGTVDEILTQAEYLVALRDRMFEDMAARCGTTGPELSAEHQTMKIYSAQQALEKGFIDRISGSGDAQEAGEPETETPAPVQNACKVYEYERVEMALAMVADAENETGETKNETEEEAEPAKDEPAKDEPAEDEPAEEEPAEESAEDESAEDETAKEKPATDAALAKMVAGEVQRQLAAREAQMLAEMGAPAAALPRSGVASVQMASRVQYTMAELDAMPAMQRLDVLRKNPALAAAYAAHI